MKRRLLSFFLCCLCVAGALCMSGSVCSAGEADFILGDADVNGEIEIIDITVILRHGALMKALSFKGENLGDVNRDGDIDIIDATLLQRSLAGMFVACPIGNPVARRTMRFENGTAQRILDLTVDNVAESADVVRFTVYVETDYDTDLDGKPDLVKTWVQLPRPAAEGDYPAPVILEANPYSAGTRDPQTVFSSAVEELPESLLHNQPSKRVPAGCVTTEYAASLFKSSDIDYYTNYRDHSDLLSRGFAVAGSAGLGTKGSEGFTLSGSRMEADAFKCIVEWLCGDRAAYIDRDGNCAVKADWSSGSVGMTGFSYSGATALEVAASGVKGLKTIVPVSAPASWYDYTNSQGTPTTAEYDYGAFLSGFCASRFFDGALPPLKALYERWRLYAVNEQAALQGNYGAYWESRDYTSYTESLKASALIVQGLNDDNVTPKHADLMRRAFERCGITPKLLLLQNGHTRPAGSNDCTDIMIGDMTYKELLNRWFSHYLAGVDNGIENLPCVLAQNNTDGSFTHYDSLDEESSMSLSPDCSAEFTQVSAKGAYKTTGNLMEHTLNGQSCDCAALWKTEVKQPITVKGAAEIALRLKTDNLSTDNPTVAAILVDYSDEPFDAYVPTSSGISQTVIGGSPYIESDKLVRWNNTPVHRKIIASGIMDLCDPHAGYLPSSAVDTANPAQSGEWYEYRLYLNPNIYTVEAGHRLELYILPYVGLPNEWDNYTPEELEALGYTDSPPVIRRDDYTFTIDNRNSAAHIPLA